MSENLSSHPSPPSPINGTVNIYSVIIKNTLASVSEAELGALFLDEKDAISIHTTLDKLGHPQEPTHIQTYGKSNIGIANNAVKQNFPNAV